MDLVVFGLGVIRQSRQRGEILNGIKVVETWYEPHVAISILHGHECLVGHVQVDGIMSNTVVDRCVDIIFGCQRHVFIGKRRLHGIGLIQSGVIGING